MTAPDPDNHAALMAAAIDLKALSAYCAPKPRSPTVPHETTSPIDPSTWGAQPLTADEQVAIAELVDQPPTVAPALADAFRSLREHQEAACALAAE